MSDLLLLNNIENEINNEIKCIVNKINGEKLLLFLLIQHEIMFSSISSNKQYIYAKESLSENFSYVINLIINYKKIKIKNLQKFDISEFILKNQDILKILISFLMTRDTIIDFKIYISKQKYKLNIHNNIFTIDHEIENFTKYYKLGYLRSYIEDFFQATLAIKDNNTNFINVVQKSYEREIPFYQIMDKNTSLERIRFLFTNQLFKILSNINDGNSQYRINSAHNNYFRNSSININDKCTKKTNITWHNLLKFSICISNISIFMDNILKDKCTNDRIFNNSILFPMPYLLLLNSIKEIFNEINKNITEKDVQQFINKFTTDLTKSKLNDNIDIQFKPFIKVSDNFYFLLFRTLNATNLIRAYLSNNNHALDDQGDKFEIKVKETLLKRFENVIDNVNYINKDNEKGEIDICILGNKNIFLIECKNRIHPISASSSTNNYEYIMKASQVQLPKAEKYVNENRKAFIKTYFNKTVKDIESFNIYKIVILSNRNLSGLNYKGTAIRDIFSLDRILTLGYAKHGYTSLKEKSNEKNFNKIYFWENNKEFQEKDLINYLSTNSKFFKYIEDNIAVEEIKEYKYKDYIFREKVYAFKIYEEN